MRETCLKVMCGQRKASLMFLYFAPKFEGRLAKKRRNLDDDYFIVSFFALITKSIISAQKAG